VQRLSDSDETMEQVRRFIGERLAIANRYGLATVAQLGEGLTGAMKVMGAEQVCLAAIDNPGLVQAFVAYEHEINLRSIEVLGDLGVDIVRRNGFYETADFYSPAMLEQLIGPSLRAEATAIRTAGMHASYTVHSGVMPIIEHLASLTMDSLFGIDIAFEGFDLATFCDGLTGSTTKSLWIGPSSTSHLWAGPDATRAAVREVFNVIGKRGLVLAPGVSAHSIMPWESTLAMIDEWKRLR